MAKTNSSKRWLERQRSDHYVQQAKEAGFRSRSAFKLLEIQEKDKLLRPGTKVVDLGAAPGGWSQVAAKLVGQSGLVLAIDILAMEPIKGVDIVVGDFQEPKVIEDLVARLKGQGVDLVISDIAPNLTGISVVDQARAIGLAELALEFAERVLVKDGNFLIKIFQGAAGEVYLAELKKRFKQVIIRKPKASRAESREVYLLAKGYRLDQVIAADRGNIQKEEVSTDRPAPVVLNYAAC